LYLHTADLPQQQPARKEATRTKRQQRAPL